MRRIRNITFLLLSAVVLWNPGSSVNAYVSCGEWNRLNYCDLEMRDGTCYHYVEDEELIDSIRAVCDNEDCQDVCWECNENAGWCDYDRDGYGSSQFNSNGSTGCPPDGYQKYSCVCSCHQTAH